MHRMSMSLLLLPPDPPDPPDPDPAEHRLRDELEIVARDLELTPVRRRPFAPRPAPPRALSARRSPAAPRRSPAAARRAPGRRLAAAPPGDRAAARPPGCRRRRRQAVPRPRR